MLIIFSGSSGAGKNTVIEKLMEHYPNMEFMKKHTDRPKRVDDREGRNACYHYVSTSEFEDMIETGKLVEWIRIHLTYRGTSKSEVAKVVENKNKIYVADLNIDGAYFYKKELKDVTKVATIFLTAPKDELQKRLKNRGQTQEEIQVRLSIYEKEQAEMPNFDLVINNLVLEDTVKKIVEYIDAL